MPRRKTPPVVETLPNYLEEALRLADEFSNNSEQTDGPWFRGANDRSHKLLPGAYWRRNVDEKAIVVEFMAEAPPYLERGSSPGDLWEWYFLMQHYGLPTRLLDWTENALVGLYFALIPRGSRPCVWVLNPAQLNHITISDAAVLAPSGDFSKYWLPMSREGDVSGCQPGKPASFTFGGKGYTNEPPIAIFAARRNARILAQQGTFTIHGSSSEPLNTYLDHRTPPLARIDVKAGARGRLLKDLAHCGVHEARVFPELDRLGRYIKDRLLIKP